MTDSTSPPSPLEQIKIDFLRELERRGVEQLGAIIEEFIQRFPDIPDLETPLRELARLQRDVDDSRSLPPEPIPDRLGEFDIVRKMDHGGMGEIYEARHARLNRRVVVKTIRRGRGSPEDRIRFEREQRVLARLHQTNVIPIYTSGEQGEIQYYAMPYIEGANLSSVVGKIKSSESLSSHDSPGLVEWVGRLVKEKDEGVGSLFSPAPAKPHDPELTGEKRLPTPLALSETYFRSVAEVMANTAQAVQHVHDSGFLHRDIKPSNIMVEDSGHAWLIDFGLARSLEPDNANGSAVADSDQSEDERLTQLGAVAGTPPYMAPEQWQEKKLDARTDVWALGVSLYELLTLHRAFTNGTAKKLEESVLTQAPCPPRKLVRNLPMDLVGVCQKAMAKEKENRYASAQDFGEDLGRWMRWEPTKARPAGVFRRIWLWSRRNKGWAAATVLGLISLLIAVLAWGSVQINAANAAEARTAKARADAKTAKEAEKVANAKKALAEAARKRAQERAKQFERESLLQKLQKIRLTTHTAGWFQRTWLLAHKAAVIRSNAELRDQAASLLIGYDAQISNKFTGFGTTSVAFGPKGKRLLMGGWRNDPARIVNGRLNKPTLSMKTGSGPAAFRGQIPLQLVLADDKNSVILWDIDKQKLYREFRFPEKARLTPVTVRLAISTDATLIAVALISTDQKATILVWNTKTGKLLLSIAQSISALAFSPDNHYLATGTKRGWITIWDVHTGEQSAKFQSDNKVIMSLAFGKDVRLLETKNGKKKRLNDWFLATGDNTGTVVLWDLRTGHPRNFFRGSVHSIYAIAFSHDGTTIAIAGRGGPALWDIATGEFLLRIDFANVPSSLAFSPDGRQLAVGALPVFGEKTGAYIWDLESHRGINQLRGLIGGVRQIAWSPDGKLVAALTDQWHVGTWDMQSGHLLYVKDVPQGAFVDNASLKFSHDGKALAFAAGSHNVGKALEWNAGTGEELRSWRLRPGLQNRLAYRPDRKLLFFQAESKDGKSLPAGQYPWVCRVYELLDEEKLRQISEINEIDRHVFLAGAAPDASYFVIDGLKGRGKPSRCTIVVDGFTGKALHSWRAAGNINWSGRLVLDPTGKKLAIRVGKDHDEFTLVALPSGRHIGSRYKVSALRPNGEYWAFVQSGAPFGCSLFRNNNKDPLVTLGIDSSLASSVTQFDRTGNYLAWGTPNGSVNVCDLNELQKRLSAADLAW